MEQWGCRVWVAAGWGIFFSLTHNNIGLELINLSPLLLDYTHEPSDVLDLLSEGGLSLKDGIYLR